MNQEVVIALVTALMPFLVSGAIALFHRLMSKLPANRQAQAAQVASVVVSAVEQLYKAAPGSPAAKKAEALKLASAMLKDLGVKVSPETLNVLLEAAVRSLPAG